MVKTAIISIFESKLIYLMNGHRLKLYLFLSLLSLFSLAVQSQNLHFIYIQTENQKPFYIKINGQTIPSSSAGYIVIPRLTQGTYKSYIGFPKTELPELAINFIINDADAGYLLRNDTDQGLYMVDLLTKKFIPTERQWPVIKNTIKSKDEFARILSQVVNDSSINEVAIFKKPVEVIVKSEQKKTVTSTAIEPPPAIIQNAPKIIVNNKDTVTQPIQTSVGEVISANPNKKRKVKKDIAVIQKKSTLPKPTPEKQKDTIAVLKTNIASSNSKCHKTATQKDFLDLTKKMGAEKTEIVKRALALKQFTITCFTTEQIKNLGALFIKEDDRYKFYVSAYPYVADIENFATLESQLTESYYIIRFRAMVQH
jgi:Domain of unknown function (DUF4476)